MNLDMISDKIENVIGRVDFGKRKIGNKSDEKNNQQNSQDMIDGFDQPVGQILLVESESSMEQQNSL